MASVGAAAGEKMISSDAKISKKTYNIRQLDTRSVTLFPTGAQVVREIKDIPLKVSSTDSTVIRTTSHTSNLGRNQPDHIRRLDARPS